MFFPTGQKFAHSAPPGSLLVGELQVEIVENALIQKTVSEAAASTLAESWSWDNQIAAKK